MSASKMRIEKDFLGSKEVPIEAYYGVQTSRAMENFPITGYRIHEDLIKAMAVVKKAAATANMEVKLLNPRIGEAICMTADEIIRGQWHEQFIVDPIQGCAGTSINMNTNEVIANRALEILGEKKGNYSAISPNTHVNMAQSTNDAFPTAVHIAILMGIDRLTNTMEDVYDAFVNKAKEFESVIKMGRTHLQDAVPIRMGQEFESYSQVFKRDIERIKRHENIFIK